MHLDLLRAALFVVLGGVFGFAGGLFGIGGATLSIPTLGIAFGMSEQLAQGTALVMALPNVAVGLFRYSQKARLDVRAALLVGIVALPTTYLSAAIATSVPSRPLRIGFAIFLIVIALDIGRRALRPGPLTSQAVFPWWGTAFAGAFCGIFSGFFGIGGAIILVPALTMFFGYTQLAAQGMSLAYSIATAVITTAAYATHGDVDWSVSLPLTVGGVVAVRYGVDLAHRLPERGLRFAFVVFAIGVGIALLLKAHAG